MPSGPENLKKIKFGILEQFGHLFVFSNKNCQNIIKIAEFRGCLKLKVLKNAISISKFSQLILDVYSPFQND